MDIAVIGAGHAGVEAAAAAAKAGAKVTLFSREAALPYFRPRLVAVAFGQAEPDSISMHPEEWYRRNNIELRLETEIVGLDTRARTLRAKLRGVESATAPFDGIVVASGAAAIMPAFPGTGVCVPAPLWQLTDALEIRRRLGQGTRLALIGGGLIGIEAAVRAVMAGLRVTIIEKAPRLMAANLGATAARELGLRLESRGTRVLVGVSVCEVDGRDGACSLVLDNGDRVDFDLCIVSIGARANLEFARSAGLAAARGITVDSKLRGSAPGFFACGDVAQVGDATRCSAPRASAQGRIAGRNACAAPGGPLEEYVPGPEPVFLKCGDVEVHAFGAVADGRAPGLTEATVDSPAAGSCRVQVLRDGKPAGIQMVGTKADFDKFVHEIA